MTNFRVNLPVSEVMRDQARIDKATAEVARLRTALREIASVVSLDTCSIPGCHMQKIRAIVERAVGGES